MKTRVLVLSDLHIAPPGPLASFDAGTALAAFLRASARPDTTLVLAGDIVDFLQVKGRPSVLDMPGAPDLIRRTLAAIAAEPWGRAILDGLGDLLRAGGQCVLLPGNHDPELHHPHARAAFLDAIGLPDHPGFTLHTDDDPWTANLDGHRVLVGHGHRADDWNDIDPAAVRRALATGDASVDLPPGSRLVLEVLNQFKEALDPKSGDPRFRFVDLLKPEKEAVALLLLYLDPKLAVSLLGKAFNVATAKLTRRFARRISWKPVLAGGPGGIDPPKGFDEELADLLAGALTEAERQATDKAIGDLQSLLDGAPAPAPGMLATHNKRRLPLRAWLRLISQDGSFFDTTVASEDDRAIIARHLPEGVGPATAIFGHTHAARRIELGGGRVYINTGTWMDLMKLPAFKQVAETEAWIDALEAGHVPRLKRLTYAEVTSDGASLKEWPAV